MVSLPLPLSRVEEFSADGIRCAARLGIPLVIPSEEIPVRVRPGQIAADAGRAAAAAIETGSAFVLAGLADVLVTAPVSKKAMHLAGVREPGQTELVMRLTSSRGVAMMLASDVIIVGLVTIHLPLRRVSRMLTRRHVREKIVIVHDALRRDWGIRRPHLAVLGLNPHAGEEGDLGDEDRNVIAPVVRRLRGAGMSVVGPFPADGFFAHYAAGAWDGVIAMYHDQGLIPFKMMADTDGVNVSAGLRIVRTSPAHGTAFDIAWQGVASHRSTVAAVLLGVQLATERSRHAKETAR
jgi:4-hydroxythreonine-4-phosphate dehydrogenase